MSNVQFAGLRKWVESGEPGSWKEKKQEVNVYCLRAALFGPLHTAAQDTLNSENSAVL